MHHILVISENFDGAATIWKEADDGLAVAASPTRRNNAMTLSTPILASALVLAVAALLAMRSAAATAAARMVKVRVDRRRSKAR
ncbi:hypothetical protein NKK48_06680 [Mesorhizobium sp. C386A]|uniref:hypothetical protein n=1 Tax=unclassified Mesorhizobium TaxID=325217 RepID=UPI0003CE43EE|nr:MULTISPECIES: hypothetical protein [unclassified Mesorhizobium]ESY39186.1 hypothetical protein X748_06535 [Mesorhizobium sp. LNJC386A00]